MKKDLATTEGNNRSTLLMGMWSLFLCIVLAAVSIVLMLSNAYHKAKSKEIMEVVTLCQDSKTEVFFEMDGDRIIGVGCRPFADHPEAPIGLRLPGKE